MGDRIQKVYPPWIRSKKMALYVATRYNAGLLSK